MVCNSSSISDHIKNVSTPSKCFPQDKLPSPSWNKKSPSSSSGTASMSSWSKTSTPLRNSSRIKDFPTELKMAVGRRPEQNSLVHESTRSNKGEKTRENRSQKTETNNNNKGNEFQPINAVFQERSISLGEDGVMEKTECSTHKSGETWRVKTEGVRTKVVVADSSWINKKSGKHFTCASVVARDTISQPLTSKKLKESPRCMTPDLSSAPTEVMMNLSSSFKELDDSSDCADATTEINKNPNCTKNIIKSHYRKSVEKKEHITTHGNNAELNYFDGLSGSSAGRLQRLLETTSSGSTKNNDGSIQSTATSVGVETGVGVPELRPVAIAAKTYGVSTLGEISPCVYEGNNYKVKKDEEFRRAAPCLDRESRFEAMLNADLSKEKLKNVSEQKTDMTSSAPSISTPQDSSYGGLEQEYEKRGLEQSKTQIQHLYSPDRVLFSKMQQKSGVENAFQYSQERYTNSKSKSTTRCRGGGNSLMPNAKPEDEFNSRLKLSALREKPLVTNSEKFSIPYEQSPDAKNRELCDDEGKNAVCSISPAERYLSAINSTMNGRIQSENKGKIKEVHKSNNEKRGSTMLNRGSENTALIPNENEHSKKVLSVEVSKMRSFYEQGNKNGRDDDDNSIDVKSVCSIFEESTVSSNGKACGNKSSFESRRFLFEKETRQRVKTSSIRGKFETTARRRNLSTTPGRSSGKKSDFLPVEVTEELSSDKNPNFGSQKKSGASDIDVKKATSGALESSDSSRLIQLDTRKISQNEAIQNCKQNDSSNFHGDHTAGLSIQDRIRSFSARTQSIAQVKKHKNSLEIDNSKEISMQTSPQKLPFSVLNKENDENTRSDKEGYEDGVTLDLSISDVSGLTIPTCIRSKEELSTISRQSSDLRVFSEASSSQTSEAARPLLAMSLYSKYFNSSDEYGYFAHRSFGERLANHNKWTPGTTPIHEKTGDAERFEDLTWAFGNAESNFGQILNENADDKSILQHSWGSLDESGWQSFETWNADMQSKSLNAHDEHAHHRDRLQRDESENESMSRLPEIQNKPMSRSDLKHTSFENAPVTISNPTEDEKEFRLNTVSSVFMSKLQSLREARIRRNSEFSNSKFSKYRNQVLSGSPVAGYSTSTEVGKHSASHNEASTNFGGDHFSNCLEIE